MKAVSLPPHAPTLIESTRATFQAAKSKSHFRSVVSSFLRYSLRHSLDRNLSLKSKGLMVRIIGINSDSRFGVPVVRGSYTCGFIQTRTQMIKVTVESFQTL